MTKCAIYKSSYPGTGSTSRWNTITENLSKDLTVVGVANLTGVICAPCRARINKLKAKGQLHQSNGMEDAYWLKRKSLQKNFTSFQTKTFKESKNVITIVTVPLLQVEY